MTHKDNLTAVTEAIVTLVDTLVRGSLERIEETRLADPHAVGVGMFNRAGAAEYLAIGKTTLDELRRAGEIKTVTIKGSPRYTRAELDRFVRKQEKNGG